MKTNPPRVMDPELLSDVTRLLIDRAHELVAHVPGNNGDLVVNAMLGAVVNFAFATGGAPAHVQTCFRKMADAVPKMYKALDVIKEQSALNDNEGGE